MRVLEGLRGIGREAWGEDRRGIAAFTLLLLFLAVGPLLYLWPAGVGEMAVGGGPGLSLGNTLLCLVAFLTAALTFLSGSSLSSPRPLAIPLGATAALALLGVVQLLPLPLGWLEAVAPVNTVIYHETAELLRLFGRAAPAPRISIAPTETADTLLLIAAYAALFAAASTLLRHRFRRRLAIAALLGSALVQVVLAAVGQSREGRVHGPFANPDHFAGYLELALAVAFGALWAEVLTNRDRAADVAERRNGSSGASRRWPPGFWSGPSSRPASRSRNPGAPFSRRG